MKDPASIVPARVVITGMSVATGLGFEVEDFWSALLSGKCAIRRVSWLADDSPLPVQIAGQVDDVALEAGMQRCKIKDPDRSTRLGLYVVGRALEDALYDSSGATPLDLDLIMGSGHGNVGFQYSAFQTFHDQGYRRLRPTTIVRGMFNRAANVASIRYNLVGSTHAISCACATASIGVGEAFNRIRFGLAQGVVAAAHDAGLDAMIFTAWNRLGVLSTIPDPKIASRPFDRGRKGLVMGEGAAALVMESLESARKRGARILAEVVGYGASCDAKHLVQPDAGGQVRAIQKALVTAGLEADQIDYVNAHATATEVADWIEAESIRLGLGARGATVPVSNTKAQLGHLMGATAGVELVATIQALIHQVIPPSRNLEDPDPRCPLQFVRDEPQSRKLTYALKNSFAFGGTNSVVILKRFEQ